MKVLDNMTVLPKRDTYENFKSENPIPREKELICVLMKNGKCKWKIGDGKTCFNKLKFTNKISDIEEFILYSGKIEASTTPKFVSVRDCVVYINPFKFINKQTKK